MEKWRYHRQLVARFESFKTQCEDEEQVRSYLTSLDDAELQGKIFNDLQQNFQLDAQTEQFIRDRIQ